MCTCDGQHQNARLAGPISVASKSEFCKHMPGALTLLIPGAVAASWGSKGAIGGNLQFRMPVDFFDSLSRSC
jgi:hypothetical protein